MCGIVGLYRPGGTAAPENVLVSMRDRMAHRGPDGVGTWYSPDRSCGLGHRRLSIIDLSPEAAQPMLNESGTVALAFNGELYNHADVRRELEATGRYHWRTNHSDTEVLLHAYEEWGPDCVKRFYGMFALAVWDGREPGRPKVHLVRDRIGIKPLYLARTKTGEWLFASEIRGILAHPDLTPEMDKTAFWHYLTFIVAPAPLTLFRGVFKIPAGHRVTIDHEGRAEASEWWDCKPSAANTLRESDLSPEEGVKDLTRLLKKSIARRMVSDVPFGVLLSGGLDSSMNVALMSELMDRPVSTFTIGYEGKEDYNEFQFARRVAKRYGTDHHERIINRKQMQDFLPTLVQLQDEPIADNVCIPLYFLAELVKQSGTTVVQVGEGADENLLGYWWCESYRKKYEDVYRPALSGRSMWQRLLGRGKELVVGPEDEEIRARAEAHQEMFWGGAACWWGDLRTKLTPDSAPFRQAVDCPVEGLFPESHAILESHEIVRHYLGRLGPLVEPEVLQKITYMELKNRLPEHLLMRVDKMTMAHAVEARVPFLDHELVEWMMRLPPSYKLRDGTGKWLLKKAAEPYLDTDMIYRKKQGFGAPMDEWFTEGDFGQRAVAAFERSTIRKEGFLNNDWFMGMLKDQIAGKGGYSFHLWTVLNAVLWHESWIEGRQDCF